MLAAHAVKRLNTRPSSLLQYLLSGGCNYTVSTVYLW